MKDRQLVENAFLKMIRIAQTVIGEDCQMIAIKTILDLYNKEKEKNKKLMSKIDVTNWQEKMSHEILDEKYISKDKIKEKLDRAKEVMENLQLERDKEVQKIVINYLEELLEERN